ncbi:MAG: hypothetical protein GY928_11295, partial [Colwellia sp.]|nr:hypothetical protein [Colwellia sp.]
MLQLRHSVRNWLRRVKKAALDRIVARKARIQRQGRESDSQDLIATNPPTSTRAGNAAMSRAPRVVLQSDANTNDSRVVHLKSTSVPPHFNKRDGRDALLHTQPGSTVSESNSVRSKSVEFSADAIIDRKSDHSSPNDRKRILSPTNTSNVSQINLPCNATREPSLESLRISDIDSDEDEQIDNETEITAALEKLCGDCNAWDVTAKQLITTDWHWQVDKE